MARRKARTNVGQSQTDNVTRQETEACTAVATAELRSEYCSPHGFEQLVRFELESRHSFASLVVRRIPGGICLQGVLDVDDDLPDVDSLARRVAGVDQVLNQLVMVRRPQPMNRLGAVLQ